MDDFAAARLATRVHDDVELARDHLHAVEVLLEEEVEMRVLEPVRRCPLGSIVDVSALVRLG
jgi:hypothetical protein